MKRNVVDFQKKLRTTELSLFDFEAYRPLIETIASKEQYVKAYGKRLQKCRQSRCISQKVLARSLDISYGAIHKIETGKLKKINVDYFLLFCQYFNATPEYFLGFEEEPIKRDRLAAKGSAIPLKTYLKNEEQIATNTSKNNASTQTKPILIPVLVDPFEPIEKRYLNAPRFIISRLWDKQPLLYKLYVFSNQSHHYHQVLLDTFELTFLKNRDFPSKDFLEIYQGKPLPYSTEIALVYLQMLYDYEHGICTTQTYGYADYRKIFPERPLYITEVTYTVQKIYEDAFLYLRSVNPDLLDGFSKIAFLDDFEQNKMDSFLNNFEISN